MLNGNHVPREGNAISCVLIGLGVILLGGLTWVPLWAAYLFGLFLAAFGIIEMYLVLNRGAIERKEADIAMLKVLAECDPETRQALGVLLPQYNFRWDGQRTVICWQDTAVPRDIFWKFLRESNDKTTVAQRTWKAERLHGEWLAIYGKLVDMKLVHPASSHGPYSEEWVHGGWNKAYEYWPPDVKELE